MEGSIKVTCYSVYDEAGGTQQWPCEATGGISCLLHQGLSLPAFPT